MAVGVVCAVSGCSGQEEPDYWLESSAEAVVVDLPAEGRAAFGRAYVRALALDEITHISQARAWNDTLVGIVDAMACEAVLVSIAGEEAGVVRRFGGCGDGPGEFRAPTDLHLDGDTLIVVDADNGRITFLPLDGGGSRDIHVPRVTDDPWMPLEIVTADAESVVLLASLPGGGVSADAGMVRTIRRDDATLVATAVPDAPLAGSNPAVLPRRISGCWDPETDRIVVANRWRVERLILERTSNRTVRRLVSALPWFETPEVIDDDGGMVPAGFVRLVCGGGQALIVWRGRPRTPNADRYVMELIATDGTQLLAEQGLLEGDDHPARFGLAGRARDGWVLYTNLDPAGPMLRVIEFAVPAREGG